MAVVRDVKNRNPKPDEPLNTFLNLLIVLIIIFPGVLIYLGYVMGNYLIIVGGLCLYGLYARSL